MDKVLDISDQEAGGSSARDLRDESLGKQRDEHAHDTLTDGSCGLGADRGWATFRRSTTVFRRKKQWRCPR
jgi:hypothetical protein